MADLIQFRRDTAERWTAINPVLAEGELGLVLGSSNQYKVGDGVTHWNDLPLKGFNGNILDELGNDYGAVISQGGLSLVLKSIVNNNSKVNIDELDSINDRHKQGLYAIVPNGGNSKSVPIGHMLLTADPMVHTINQWVFGNFTVEGNNISISHVDGCHSILVRSYNRASGYLGDIGTWTKWRYYQQEFIKSEKDADDGEKWTYGATKIQSLLSALKSTLEEKVNNVNSSLRADFNETNENVNNLESKFNYLNAKTDKLEGWLITHDNVTTIDALNQELDSFNAETAQGLHRMKCFGIPLFVTFSNLNVDSSVFMQTIQGSITFNSTKTNIASINTVGNLTIAVRYYQGGRWGAWNTPMTPIEPPTVQTSANGTSKNYIYSTGTDADKNCVASCNWWIYSENGRVYVRWKRWGADNNTHYDHDNEEHQTSQYMIPYMGIDNGACYQDGLLPWQWGQRMKDCGINFRFIQEQLSTADYVNLRYLNFSNGERYDTPISAATSAKAGVMTAKQYTQLSALNEGLMQVKEGGKKVFRTLQGDKVIETHCDYVGEEVSLEDFNKNVTDTTYTEGDKIELFKTRGAYGVSSGNYMVWFGRRERDAGGSSHNALLRYDFKTIAGVEPLALYNSGVGYKLHFWTLTKGYATCYKGSGGIQPLFRTVPYVMNTDDKALIDKIEDNF